MNVFVNALIFIICLVHLTWAIHVPELTRSILNLSSGDFVHENVAINEKEPLRRDSDQNFNKNLFNFNTNDDDSNIKHNYGHRRLLTALRAKTHAHQHLPIPNQQKSYDIDDNVDASAENRSSFIVHKNLEAQPSDLIKHQQHDDERNDDLLTEIIKESEHHNNLYIRRQRRQLSDFLIAPNTRWCGRGNIANGTYNHLGGATMADKCCRTHDHCKLYIPAMSNRYDLFNYRPYTLSHCNCDRRFRTCLKMANDEDANTIGKLFFNLVQTQCFLLTKEVTCQERSLNGTCLKEHIKQKAYLRNNKKY